MKEFIFSMLKNEAVMWAVFSVIIFALTQLLKMPIKHFTKLLDEKRRKRVNLTIYIIPFGLGLFFAWIYYNILPTIPGLEMLFNSDFWFLGLKMGSSSIAIYGIIDQCFGIKVKNPYTTTADGRRVVDAVNDIMEDGKVTKEEIIEKTKALSKEETEQITTILKSKGL